MVINSIERCVFCEALSAKRAGGRLFLVSWVQPPLKKNSNADICVKSMSSVSEARVKIGRDVRREHLNARGANINSKDKVRAETSPKRIGNFVEQLLKRSSIEHTLARHQTQRGQEKRA